MPTAAVWTTSRPAEPHSEPPTVPTARTVRRLRTFSTPLRVRRSPSRRATELGQSVADRANLANTLSNREAPPPKSRLGFLDRPRLPAQLSLSLPFLSKLLGNISF